MNTTTPPYAPFGSRLWAYIIDQSIIQTLAMVALTPYLIFKWPEMNKAIMTILSLANPASFAEIPDTDILSNDVLMLVVYAIIVYVIVTIIIGLAYGTLMEAGKKGATFGKRHCKLRVTAETGNQLSYGAAFLRNIGVNLPTVLINLSGTGTLILCLVYCALVFTKRHQTFYDMTAKSVVIRTV